MSSVRRPAKRPKMTLGLITKSHNFPERKQSEEESSDEGDLKHRRTSMEKIGCISPVEKHGTRFLIISDTHGMAALPELPTYVHIDVVLHCGDLSEYGTLEEYRNTINLLCAIDAPLKLVIAGNHDLTLDKKYWLDNSTPAGYHLHEDAKQIWEDAEVQGVRLLEDGLHNITLQSGKKLSVYASSATPNHSRVSDWAFGHPTVEDRYNPTGIGISYSQHACTNITEIPDEANIDIVMTHTPAKYFLDLTSNRDSLGCQHLFRALRRTRPWLHACGHIHEDYGALFVEWKEEFVERDGSRTMVALPEDDDVENGVESRVYVDELVRDGVRFFRPSKAKRKETLFVNAAMVGGEFAGGRLPFLVELHLQNAVKS